MKCWECGSKLSYWEELFRDRCKTCTRDEDPPEKEDEIYYIEEGDTW